MARLDRKSLESLKLKLDNSKHRWLFAAFKRTNGSEAGETMEGPLGYFDWRLHGQVSRLVRSKVLKEGSITMIPSQRHLGESNLLIYTSKNDEFNDQDVESIIESLEKLQVDEVCFVDATWPEDIAKNIKSSLNNKSISYASLEDGV